MLKTSPRFNGSASVTHFHIIGYQCSNCTPVSTCCSLKRRLLVSQLVMIDRALDGLMFDLATLCQ